MTGSPHESKKCPLHDQSLVYTRGHDMVVCPKFECRYWEHLLEQLTVRIVKRTS